jgi:adenylate cyclase
VRYVLEGSVRKGGNRVRITAQLIEAETGTHLWADRFDGSLEDVFDLQDKVAASVAGVIEPALQVNEIRRSGERPTADLTAYDFYLRALSVMFRLGKEDLVEAANLLDQAIARDPRFGPALAFASICHLRLVEDGWAADSETGKQTAIRLAHRALEVARNDPTVLANAAFTLARLGEEITTMIALIDRALSLNPSYARGWSLSGMVHLWAGQPDLAIEHVERSLRLAPGDYFGNRVNIIGMAHFLAGRDEEAAYNFRLAIREAQGAAWMYRFLAASCAYLGRREEAREVINQLRTTGAPVMPTGTSVANRELRERMVAGLRLAMGETA